MTCAPDDQSLVQSFSQLFIDNPPPACWSNLLQCYLLFEGSIIYCFCCCIFRNFSSIIPCLPVKLAVIYSLKAPLFIYLFSFILNFFSTIPHRPVKLAAMLFTLRRLHYLMCTQRIHFRWWDISKRGNSKLRWKYFGWGYKGRSNVGDISFIQQTRRPLILKHKNVIESIFFA